MTPRELLRQAAAQLALAGVASPEYDASVLLAHVLGVPRSGLFLIDEVAAAHSDEFEALINRRSEREPLQHLTGNAAFRHIELAVGPGVFVPRPETELLAGWAIEQAQALPSARVVDLCTGSGAVALSIADEVPNALVHAVELDPQAHDWAARNVLNSQVDLRLGDMAEAFTDLDGTVDVVTANPPYIPMEAWESVAVEARDHDPSLALWSGDDGLDAMRVVERTAARLLKPGGVVGAEHADVQGVSAPEVFLQTNRWVDVRDHRDLAGRPRFLTARLAR